VTGPRQKFAIPDMSMEIPCVLTFTHSDPHILEKAKKLLETKGFKDKLESIENHKNKPKRKKGSQDESMEQYTSWNEHYQTCSLCIILCVHTKSCTVYEHML